MYLCLQKLGFGMEIKQVMTQNRIVWLDWMKVLAILSILWGHFFSSGHLYLYVFSVQVFCVISGFLYHKSSDFKTCVRKCFWQLFVPTVIMSTIMHLVEYLRCMALGQPYDISWPWFFEWLLLGHRWCMGPCWYFYSLIVMRLIMQLLPERKWIYGVLFVVLSAGAVCWHIRGVEVSNANVNVLVCMPFFLMGIFLKPLKGKLSGIHSFPLEIGMLVLAAVFVYLCGQYNGYVWMYLCGYGENFILYIIGGMSGAAMLYVISLWLSRVPCRNMMISLSKGSILVIGLHIPIVNRLTELPDRLWGEDLFFAMMIMFAFVPLIRLAEIYFPLLLGRHQ